MKSDFLDAHMRHYSDANTLYTAQRWANADHLYGVAAECGLKCLMQVFGMVPDPVTGLPPPGDRVHVMEGRKPSNAWDRYEAYRSGHGNGATYVLPSPNPFLDWDVGQRYAHQSHFDPSRVDPHQQAAQKVYHLVKQAQMDSLL